MRRAGRRSGRRVDGQPVVGSESLDAGDVTEQRGTAVPGGRRGGLLLLLRLRWSGRNVATAGRAAYDDGLVVGRWHAAVKTAARGRGHRGAARLDDHLAAAAVVRGRHAATAAAAVTTFLVHHCGRVRVARRRYYHAWTAVVAGRHGAPLLAAAV